MDKTEPLKYMPDYYNGVYEMEELLKAQGTALAWLDGKRERTLLNQFIIKTDEVGISLFEDEAGITPTPGETLEERQKNVLLHLLPPKPLTTRYLNRLFEIMNLKATANVNYGKRYAVVSANSVDIKPSDINSIKYLLNIALPATMVYQVGVSLSNTTIQREVYIGTATIAETFVNVKLNNGQLNFRHDLTRDLYIGIGSNIYTSTSVGIDEKQNITKG